MNLAKKIVLDVNPKLYCILSGVKNKQISLKKINNILYFFHMPKVAGNSISTFLRNNKVPFVHLGHDLRDPSYKGPLEILTGNEKSFCFVRNPWDRLVSSYFYLKGGGMNEPDKADFQILLSKYKHFDDFVKRGLIDEPEKLLKQIHLKPQTAWIKGEKEIIINNIFNLDNLSTGSFETYLNEYGFEINSSLPYLNGSKRVRDYRSLYDSNMVDIVSEVYGDDVLTFGYSFE